MRLSSESVPDPWSLFRQIANDAPYAAYMEMRDFVIISASPELFFELDDSTIRCRPMKGTTGRGTTTAEDKAIAENLRNSAKNRAENIMITDMIRNDLGRIADAGSVRVESTYSIEKYPTVWQMTSEVSATTAASLTDIFKALFPCASVTGAPKASSMRIISELETTPRQIYTGAIGYLAPGRQARFSVAIRTVLVDRRSGNGTYGAGGGIVWDSDADDEFEECRIKSRILETASRIPPFDLLETMRWNPDTGWFLLDFHLDRLGESADYFDYAFNRDGIERKLRRYAAGIEAPSRVRLTLSRDGAMSLETLDLPAAHRARPVSVALAAAPVDVRNPFLYHKTTYRDVYQQARLGVDGCDDVLLWNADGHITETTIANVIVEIAGERVTPPVADGLLAGTYRRQLLEQGDIVERSIHRDELAGINEIELVNSVRGSYRGIIVNPAES